MIAESGARDFTFWTGNSKAAALVNYTTARACVLIIRKIGGNEYQVDYRLTLLQRFRLWRSMTPPERRKTEAKPARTRREVTHGEVSFLTSGVVAIISV
jgi:hypothetical protein